jgi:prolyl-tRNA synthetase
MEKEFKIDKELNYSEWYTEVLKRAEIIDQRYRVKGFLVIRPNGAIPLELMRRDMEKELEKNGHKRSVFPSVIPEAFFHKEKEHVESFEAEVFWITHGSKTPLEEKLALRPTSETSMYSMYSIWIRSWRDLPLKLYQSCQVWRYETKATRPFLRDREFHWIEAHDVFATREEAEKQVEEDMHTTENILHKKFGIPTIFFKRPDWDKFAGAEYSFAADSLVPDGWVMQLPSTHFLGQNFSKAFGIKFVDKDEQEKYAYQTCYGPAFGRILAAAMSIHGDNKGMVLPFDYAPIQIAIVPIPVKGKEREVHHACKELYNSLRGKYRMVLDDSDKSPGEKFNEWEVKGASLRFEIGPREVEGKEITIVRRDTGKKEKIKKKELEKYLSKVEGEILHNLKSKADKHFKDAISDCKTLEEVKKRMDKGGIARTNFCSREKDGEPCADLLKAETHGGQVRGTAHGKEEKTFGNCVICDKKANVVVYVAKAY